MKRLVENIQVTAIVITYLALEAARMFREAVKDA